MIKGVLFQEELHKEPFWMLVACCMVNQTTWKSAEPVFLKLREKYPTIEDVARADPAKLYPLLSKLGFGKIRAQRLPTMATAYMAYPPKTAAEVNNLPGCGQYACDSWAIFIDGQRDFEPNDKELKAWLERQNASTVVHSQEDGQGILGDSDREDGSDPVGGSDLSGS